ncbi:MAG: Rieske (2Fe-2S) protein [Polyangiaceae bacterium]
MKPLGRRRLIGGAVALACGGCARNTAPSGAGGGACAGASQGVAASYCLVASLVVRVRALAQLSVGEAKLFNVDDDVAVVVARDRDGFHALSAICTHACCIVALCLDESCADLTATPGACMDSAVGEVSPDGAGLFCPCHGSSFRIADGEPLNPPAIHPLPSYALTFEGEDGLVDTGTTVDPSTRVAPPA